MVACHCFWALLACVCFFCHHLKRTRFLKPNFIQSNLCCMCVSCSHFASKARTFCQQAECVLPPLLLEEQRGDGLSDLARTSDVREPSLLDRVREEGGVSGCGVLAAQVWQFGETRGNKCRRRGDHPTSPTRDGAVPVAGMAMGGRTW